MPFIERYAVVFQKRPVFFLERFAAVVFLLP
jgi:hypothetical protein